MATGVRPQREAVAEAKLLAALRADLKNRQPGNRGPGRLGLGEYELISEYTSSREEARDYFFRAVRRHAPEVLEDLRGEPLLRYREVWARVDHDRRVWLCSVAADEDGTPYPQFVPLRECLRQWARRYSLLEQWCLERALATLDRWVDDEPGEETPGWAATVTSIGRVTDDDEERLFSFEDRGWEPAEELWGRAEARIRAAFEEQLATYRELMEARAASKGMERTPSAKKNPEHYEWLVHFQVQQWRPARIAEQYSTEDNTLEESAIRMALKGTAASLGLRLRRPPKGRPPKS